MNNYPPTKAIQTCSYNDFGSNLEKKVFEQVNREKEAGKEFVNHLILRNSSYAKDWLKFNILLDNIPLFLYNLYSMHRAGFKEVVTVGNDDTGRIHNLFCSHFGIEGFVFVHEGKPEEWSMGNTIKKARNTLGSIRDENILFCPGDTPFVDIKGLVGNKCLADYDLVVPFNTKENCGPYFPRNYHIKLVDDKGRAYLSKEANAFLMNLDKIEQNRFGEEIYEMAFNARKSYAAGNHQKKFVVELAFKEDGKFSLKRSLNALGIIGPEWFFSEVPSFILKRKILKQRENDNNLLKVKAEACSRLVEYALSIPDFHAKMYPTKDPAALIDLDSFEDVIFAEAMLRIAPRQVYPYYDELKDFANGIKEWGCRFTDDWHYFAMHQFIKYGIPAVYASRGSFDQRVFPEKRIEAEVELIKRYNENKKE